MIKIKNREWICNIVNSLIPSKFKEFIEKKVDERKENIIKSQNLRANILPQFASIFKVLNSVSLNKGRSHFLIRTPKETKQQIKLKEIEEEKNTSNRRLGVCIKKLDEYAVKIKELEEKQIDYDDNLEKLSKLFELGIIDEKANPIENHKE